MSRRGRMKRDFHGLSEGTFAFESRAQREPLESADGWNLRHEDESTFVSDDEGSCIGLDVDVRSLEVQAMFRGFERTQLQDMIAGYEWRVEHIRAIKRAYSFDYYWRMRLDLEWLEKERARGRERSRRKWAELRADAKRYAAYRAVERRRQRAWGNANYQAKRKDPAWMEAKRAREREGYHRRRAVR